MAEEELKQPEQQELFDQALAPEPKAPEPEAAAPPPPPPAPSAPPEEHIPSWRLREEAEARRQAEVRASALEARLNEIAAHLQQNQKAPDFFENPDQATQALILRTLQPYAEETRRNMMAMGKMVASAAHGADKVDAAEQAFLKARAEESLDPADYERVVGSPNRYDAVVRWHKSQTVLSSVGDDPAAWFEKQLEAKLADPAFQASLLEKVQASAAGRPSMTKLPPSLSRTTAAASNRAEGVGDLSDKSLFAYAMKR
jgi:hypothetical protein